MKGGNIIKINLNAKVKVKLTKYGKEIMNKKAPIRFHHELENNIWETKLYLLFNVFGDSFSIGYSESLFINNEIILIDEEKKV
jgi:hypothetical protein